MNSNNNRNTLLLVLVLVIVLVFAYFTLGGGTVSNIDEEARTASVEEAVTLLNKIQSIDFDLKILNSPTFSYLQDITTPPSNLPVGRSNPFAPAK